MVAHLGCALAIQHVNADMRAYPNLTVNERRNNVIEINILLNQPDKDDQPMITSLAQRIKLPLIPRIDELIVFKNNVYLVVGIMNVIEGEDVIVNLTVTKK